MSLFTNQLSEINSDFDLMFVIFDAKQIACDFYVCHAFNCIFSFLFLFWSILWLCIQSSNICVIK